MGRKTFHKKGSSPDMVREGMKFEGEEVKKKSHDIGDVDCNHVWVPHERTGIYYPKGQEKVMEDVPPAAVNDVGVNLFS
ncbi:hypothetical protein FH972_024790 [Carpinus fangiana]|uniref:Uncharacterized protein n=1 Tax=Carpinus fangiana TaxID=176857 RepID=A0A5N6KZX0_9ROSI|nr:hypothetical protein FH972_024790 [Carpinus fangiana]